MRYVLAATIVIVACTAPAATPSASPDLAPAPATEAPVGTSSPAAPAPLLGIGRADFDCDGTLDTLEFFSAPRPETYVSREAGKLARLTRGWGATVDLPFDGMPGDDPSRNPLIGIADVNGDGCDDAIVTVGHGASTTLAALLVFDNGHLDEVSESGIAAVLIYEGSVRHGASVECRTTNGIPEIVLRGVSNYTSDYQWDVVERVYRWTTPSTLALYSTATSVIPVAHAYEEPPDFARYWGLSCGSLRTPGWAFTR